MHFPFPNVSGSRRVSFIQQPSIFRLLCLRWVLAFVVLGLKWPGLGKQIPLACLLLGALSSGCCHTDGLGIGT